MTRLTGNKAALALTALVVIALAWCVYVGAKGALGPEYTASGDEGARKRALEDAVKKGNLSLHDAAYWRTVPAPEEKPR